MYVWPFGLLSLICSKLLQNLVYIFLSILQIIMYIYVKIKIFKIVIFSHGKISLLYENFPSRNTTLKNRNSYFFQAKLDNRMFEISIIEVIFENLSFKLSALICLLNVKLLLTNKKNCFKKIDGHS